MKFIGALVLSLFSIASFGGTATGKVVGFIPYSSGSEEMFFIKVENISAPVSCNTTSRFTMKSSNPRFKSTQATVLAALMAGTQVTANGLGSCNSWSNSEDLDYICLGAIPC